MHNHPSQHYSEISACTCLARHPSMLNRRSVFQSARLHFVRFLPTFVNIEGSLSRHFADKCEIFLNNFDEAWLLIKLASTSPMMLMSWQIANVRFLLELQRVKELLDCGALTAAEIAGFKKKKPLEGALSTSALLQPLPGKRWTDPDHNFRSLRRPNSAELTTAASGNASQFARRGKTKLACLLKGPSV